jgi:PAS domain S-box-containing protein
MPHVVDLQSLVETHERPFMVIDKSFTVIAANQAFARSHGLKLGEINGRHCYEVSHNNTRPCYELGEECPHKQVYETHEIHSCLHIHSDEHGQKHRVRVTVYPLQGRDGDVYLGESIQELSEDDSQEDTGISMVGASPQFLQMMEQLVMSAHADTPVLLQGETGTGKELAASFLHHNSKRVDGPFLTLDCTVLTETLFESEVFGHEHGAFTGSQGKKVGLFELANGGTLFLDEIGELSPIMQAKLLRVLETGEFRRVGGTRTLYADVRIVCATNRDLRQEVKAGAFRSDLYYRIAGLAVCLPSLHQRRSDIPVLAATLLRRIGRTRQRQFHLSSDASNWLQAQHFPGNIRELRNILSAAAATCTNSELDTQTLKRVFIHHHHSIAENEPLDQGLNVSQPVAEPTQAMTLCDMERQQITQLLAETGGNRQQVADRLGISVRTLYRKLKKFELS